MQVDIVDQYTRFSETRSTDRNIQEDPDNDLFIVLFGSHSSTYS